VTSWPLGSNGLLYDREWALVDPHGRALSQRRHPRLTQIRPTVDLDAGTLVSGSGLRIESSLGRGWVEVGVRVRVGSHDMREAVTEWRNHVRAELIRWADFVRTV
jgi:uncharacterized protein YcbX